MKKNLAFTLLHLVLLFASCSVNHYMYSSTPPQMPMLNKQGDMSLTAMLSSGLHASDTGYNNGYDLQGAYAVSNHVAVTAAWSHRNERDLYYHTGWFSPQYSADLGYTRGTTELGLGYFTPMDKGNIGFFDCYGGYGFGKYSLHEHRLDAGGDLNHSAQVSKYYLQPGVHFNFGNFGQAGLSLRFTAVSYHDIQSDYTAAQEQAFHMDSIRNTVFVYTDPCFALRFWAPDAPWIKFETQFSVGAKLSRTSLNYRAANLCLGISFDLSKIKAKTNNR